MNTFFASKSTTVQTTPKISIHIESLTYFSIIRIASVYSFSTHSEKLDQIIED